MKLMFASDIHGSRSACEAMLNAYKAEGAERLILLGDLLYHGPRNNLPDEYDPKGVIALLNGVKNELFCVRGNCDAEVDQMVLQFPILADYAVLAECGAYGRCRGRFACGDLQLDKACNLLCHFDIPPKNNVVRAERRSVIRRAAPCC